MLISKNLFRLVFYIKRDWLVESIQSADSELDTLFVFFSTVCQFESLILQNLKIFSAPIKQRQIVDNFLGIDRKPKSTFKPNFPIENRTVVLFLIVVFLVYNAGNS